MLMPRERSDAAADVPSPRVPVVEELTNRVRSAVRVPDPTGVLASYERTGGTGMRIGTLRPVDRIADTGSAARARRLRDHAEGQVLRTIPGARANGRPDPCHVLLAIGLSRHRRPRHARARARARAR
ncbi:hypothetical protein Kpho01_75400 [Kitasatospora phosalacinea]|uniref:Uncharacterized protein n=1 Tax=Kitasatospora phosalacinea TaxID=2065 RepID=A0A9W6PQL9_9ACTN|nr:hypothetical protein Kpho01_75400 [Kitasatospora phosalacinea]